MQNIWLLQIKALVTQLEENQRQMNDALAVCKQAIEANDPAQASYFSLKIEPDFREAKTALEEKQVSKIAFSTSNLDKVRFPIVTHQFLIKRNQPRIHSTKKPMA